MPLFDKALRLGEGKKFKEFEKNVAQINDFEPELELDSDEELRERYDALRVRALAGREPGRPALRVVRADARGGQAHARPAPLRRPADRRHGAARRLDRRDEDRRGQDADGHAARLPERADRPRRGRQPDPRQGRPPGHGQRLPGPPRRAVDEAHLRPAGRHRRHPAVRPGRLGPQARGLRRRRRPTAPTPSSASTTCATTWPPTRPRSPSAATASRSSTRSTTS